MWTAKPVHLPRQWVQVRQPAAEGDQCSAKQMSEAANINLRLESCPSWPSDHLCNEFFGGHKRKSCDAAAAAEPVAETSAEATLHDDGKPAKRWPNALAIVAAVVVAVAAPVWLTDLTLQGSVASDALRNYSWVHNLISNWPTGATQLPATVATRRQQAACNTIR